MTGRTRRRAEQDTLRRQDETLRREDRDRTARRPEEEATSDPIRLPEAFSCRIDGRSRRLAVDSLLTSGGEGDLYLCSSGGEQFVVKVLRYEADPDLLRSLVRSQDRAEDLHLVPLAYVGSMRDLAGQVADARLYTVSPYYARGDLAAPANMQRINPSISVQGGSVTCDPSQVDEQEFTRLLSEIHTSIRALHTEIADGVSIIHRDIRPQNILVTPSGGYLLGDFGLASGLERGLSMKLTRRFGVSHGYSPPEAYVHQRLRQQVSPKYDYFSLGMTLLHVVLGRPRYLLAADDAAPRDGEISLGDFYETIALSNVQIPGDLPERIRLLLRGLLLANPEHRWGAAEVEAWLAGNSPAVHAASVERGSGISLKVNGSIYRGTEEVAEAILHNWALFRELLGAGSLEFRWEDPDLAFRRQVENAVSAARTMDPESGLETVLLAVDPGGGHVFDGLQFRTDKELGSAMLACGEEDAAPFALYLRSGRLGRRKMPEGTDSDESAVISMLEAYAAIQPLSAVRHMGRLLTGEPLPPLEVILPSGSLRLTLPELEQQVRRMVVNMLHDYTTGTNAPLPDLAPVPGLYGDSRAPCVVQADGSVLADPGPFEVSLTIPPPLAELFAWMSGGQELQSVGFLEPQLFLHMYAAGWVRPDVDLTPRGEKGRSAEPLQQMMALLSLFPAFRTEHVLDAAFMSYFRHVLKLLDQTAGIRLPRMASGGQGVRIAAARQAAREAVQAFDSTRRWETLVHAFGLTLAAQQTAAALAPAAHAAAVRLTQVFSLVFSGKDTALQQEFDDLMHRHSAGLDDPGRLGRLMQGLERLRRKAEQSWQHDLSRYALTEELEYIRKLSRERPEAVDFVVPDTTDAEVYYTELRRWADGKSRKGFR